MLPIDGMAINPGFLALEHLADSPAIGGVRDQDGVGAEALAL